MPALIKKIIIEQGATWSYVVTRPLDANGNYHAFDNCVVRMQARPALLSAELLFELTTGNGGIVVPGAGATYATCTLSAEATRQLDFNAGVYDVECELPGGVVERIRQGKVILKREVTGDIIGVTPPAPLPSSALPILASLSTSVSGLASTVGTLPTATSVASQVSSLSTASAGAVASLSTSTTVKVSSLSTSLSSTLSTVAYQSLRIDSVGEDIQAVDQALTQVAQRSLDNQSAIAAIVAGGGGGSGGGSGGTGVASPALTVAPRIRIQPDFAEAVANTSDAVPYRCESVLKVSLDGVDPAFFDTGVYALRLELLVYRRTKKTIGTDDVRGDAGNLFKRWRTKPSGFYHPSDLYAVWYTVGINGQRGGTYPDNTGVCRTEWAPDTSTPNEQLVIGMDAFGNWFRLTEVSDGVASAPMIAPRSGIKNPKGRLSFTGSPSSLPVKFRWVAHTIAGGFFGRTIVGPSTDTIYIGSPRSSTMQKYSAAGGSTLALTDRDLGLIHRMSASWLKQKRFFIKAGN